ncbi:MAG: hypothetical protein JOZ24_08930 [Candidatus Eremiobacteraeota bacterium]|nr:hypothetical protein [Candidatus Eremiobacteraeota bacterium]
MLWSAVSLRAVLGNRVRFTLETNAEGGPPPLAARWECGCRAHGTRFSALYLAPCAVHEEVLPPQLQHG